MQEVRTPTIRELVAAIARREGVEAAVLLGIDGVVIDGRSAPGFDVDQLAAHVPRIVSAAQELGAAGTQGAIITAVIEYERGVALVSSLARDTLLLVMVHSSANIGPLLFDIRRHRGHMASVV